MRVYRDLEEVPKGKRVVAIGTFDGVHIGHQRIIGDAVTAAREKGARSMVMTFHPHPLSVIAPDKCPPILTPLNIKTDLIGNAGRRRAADHPLYRRVLPPVADRFLRDAFLHRSWAHVQVIVGDNFRFGYKAGGDIKFLEEYGKKVGMKVIAEPLVTAGDEPISSTRIRNLLIDGKLAEVREILSRPPSTHGKVVHGDKRGRTLGVRTANIEAHVDCIFPGKGVYLADLFIGKDPYACLVNVGQNPTFCSTDEDSDGEDAHRGAHPRLRPQPVRVQRQGGFPGAGARREEVRQSRGAGGPDQEGHRRGPQVQGLRGVRKEVGPPGAGSGL